MAVEREFYAWFVDDQLTGRRQGSGVQLTAAVNAAAFSTFVGISAFQWRFAGARFLQTERLRSEVR